MANDTSNIDTNLNVSPYFDDYQSNTNYHRILFKPSVPVQARELTSLQSMLQQQVSKFGDNVLQEGTIVSGCSIRSMKTNFVKVLDTHGGANTSTFTISEFSNGFLQNPTSNLIMSITNTRSGFEINNPDLNAFFGQYINSGNTVAANGDTIDQKSFTTGSRVDYYPANGQISDTFTITSGGSLFTNGDPLIFTSTRGSNAQAVVNTDSGGVITAITLTDAGNEYKLDDVPVITVSTSTGSGANISAAINSTAHFTTAGDEFATLTGNGNYLAFGPNQPDVLISATEYLANTDKYPDAVAARTAVNGVKGAAERLHVGAGIIYKKGHFIDVAQQSIEVDGFNISPNNIAVGFLVEESIVNSSIDSTLLDNAAGFNNENAPGADRLKLVPKLASKSKDDLATANDFFAIAFYEDGQINRTRTDTQFDSIGVEMAKRTAEESGDYVVKPFPIKVVDDVANTDFDQVVVGAGRGYVEGFRIETLNNSFIPIKKGIDTANIDSAVISQDFGNYVEVNELVGTFEFNTGVEVFLMDTAGDRISECPAGTDPTVPTTNTATTVAATSPAYDKAMGGFVVMERSDEFGADAGDNIIIEDAGTDGSGLNRANNVILDGTAGSAEIIGKARLRGWRHDQGTHGQAACKYKVYLFDVKMNQGKQFNDVRAVSYFSGSNAGVGFADIVLDESGRAILHETKKRNMLSRLGHKGIKTLNHKDDDVAQYSYSTIASVEANTTGFATISLTGNQVFNYTGGSTLSDTDENDFIIVANNNQAQTVALTGTVSVTAGQSNVTGSSTTFLNDYQVGDTIVVGSAGSSAPANSTQIITGITNATLLEVKEDFGSSLSANTHARKFPTDRAISLTGNAQSNIVVSSDQKSVTINMSRGKSINAALPLNVKYVVTKRQSQQKNKVLSANVYIKIDCSNNDANSVGPWCLGSPDVHKIRAVFVAHGNSTVAGSFTDIETASNTSAGDRTNGFSLERGGQDAFYNLSKLRLKTTDTTTIFANGASADLGTVTANTKILVKMQHFYVSGSSDSGYYTVDSYPVDDTTATLPNDKIRTEDIPRYISKLDGEGFDLRNSIDFRPYSANTANNGSGTGSALADTAAKATTNPATTVSFSGEQYWAAIGKNMIADYQVYLPRVDRVVLNKEGHIRVVPGEPDFNPVGPSKQHGGMSLGTVVVPQFPSLPPKLAMEAGRPDNTHQVSLKQPRGFTMKDIGQIKSEVRKLQYYSSLSLLEKNTMDLNVPSSSNVALNRFKNGILVDNFADRSIAAINDREFKASFEMPRKIVTTKVTKNKVDITPVDGSFANTQMTDPDGSGEGMISIQYESLGVVDQGSATRTRNISGSDFSYCGRMQLYPDYDNFMDVTTNLDKPPIELDMASGVESLMNSISDLPGILDAQQDVIFDQTEVEHVGTSVHDKTLNVVGERTGGGTNVVEYKQEETVQHYNNIRTVVKEKSQNQFTPQEITNTIKVGEFVTDVRFDMYVREQIIRFHGWSLKPNTRHYFTFNKDDIDAQVRPMSKEDGDSVVGDNFREAGALGDPVLTNEAGELFAEFHLPARTFFVGQNDLGITDQPAVAARFSSANYTSHAVGQFNAFNHGVDKESVDLTTKKVEYYRDRVVTGTTATVTETPSQASTYRHYNQVVDFIADPPPVVHVVQNYAAARQDDEIGDCFVPLAPVLMADGTTKPIIEIQIGDLVKGKDGVTNRVTGTHIKQPDLPFLYSINGHMPFVTAYHPILTKGGWACFEPEKFKEHRPEAYQSIVDDNDGEELIKLEVDRKIQHAEGHWERIQTLEVVDCDPNMDVYNLTVDGDRTFTVFNYIVHNKDDPIAQTFLVKSGQGVGGYFVTSLDAFFNTKDHKKGITCQLRKTEGGKPQAFTLPYGNIHLTPDQVNVSSDGTVATRFTFKAPIFLKNGESYAVVLLPDGNNPNYNAFVRTLGQPDLVTGKQLSTGGFDGTLFLSTSDGPGQWDPILDETLKFTLNRADFQYSTGSVQYENQPLEFFNLSSINGNFQQGERVFKLDNSANITGNVSFSTTSETVTGTGTTFTTDLAVGDFIALTNGTSHDVRKVSNVISNTSLTLQGFPDFTGTTTNTRIQKTPSGKVFFYENTSANKEMWIDSSTASNATFAFANNNTIIGAVSQANAEVTTVKNEKVSGFQNLMNQISPAGSKLTQFVQANTATGTTANVAFPINDINHFEQEVFIKSRSNEVIEGTGRSFKQTFRFDTTTKWVSPVIDDSTTSILKITNVVNNDNTNEHLPGQGSADAKYISKTVTLDDGQDAEDIRVYITATQPGNSELEVYARIQHELDGGNVVDKHWTKLQRVGDNTKTQPGARNQFAEHEFRMPDAPETTSLTSTGITELGNTVITTSTNESSNISVGDLLKIEHTDPAIDYQVEVVTAVDSTTITVGNEINFTNRKSILSKVTYPQVAFKDPQNEFITTYFDEEQRRYETYKVFQIKVVMLSDDSTRVPRLQDLRAIAMSV